MAKQPEIVTVDEGAVYEAKTEDRSGDKRRLIAFFVDRPRATVFASPVGAGAEERIPLEDFLNDYTKIAEPGEALPEDRNQKAARTRTEDRQTRTPRIDTDTASPTRESLEARNAARNER